MLASAQRQRRANCATVLGTRKNRPSLRRDRAGIAWRFPATAGNPRLLSELPSLNASPAKHLAVLLLGHTLTALLDHRTHNGNLAFRRFAYKSSNARYRCSRAPHQRCYLLCTDTGALGRRWGAQVHSWSAATVPGAVPTRMVISLPCPAGENQKPPLTRPWCQASGAGLSSAVLAGLRGGVYRCSQVLVYGALTHSEVTANLYGR